MPSAKDLATKIRLGKDMVVDAGTQGANAVERANETIQQLSIATNTLKQSRASAGEQLGYLTEAIDLLTVDVVASWNPEANQAYTRISEARKRAQDYYNGLTNRIDNLERLTAIFQQFVDTTVGSAADPIRDGIMSLEYWAQSLG